MGELSDPDFPLLIPDWPLPAGVRSVITMRRRSQLKSGGAEFISRDLGEVESQDTRGAQSLLMRQLDLSKSPQWLQQVHGVAVIEASGNALSPQADASYTRQPGLACAVLTADCLPLLISAKDGSLVAAIHAGWRGLADGIIAATLTALAVTPSDLMVYLGPAISAQHFEVSPQVRQAFLDGCIKLSGGGIKGGVSPGAVAAYFSPSTRQKGHYLADLYQLARVQFESLGVSDIYGGEYCTYAQSSKFYSHRRSKDVGRMASLIWIEG